MFSLWKTDSSRNVALIASAYIVGQYHMNLLGKWSSQCTIPVGIQRAALLTICRLRVCAGGEVSSVVTQTVGWWCLLLVERGGDVVCANSVWLVRGSSAIVFRGEEGASAGTLKKMLLGYECMKGITTWSWYTCMGCRRLGCWQVHEGE